MKTRIKLSTIGLLITAHFALFGCSPSKSHAPAPVITPSAPTSEQPTKTNLPAPVMVSPIEPSPSKTISSEPIARTPEIISDQPTPAIDTLAEQSTIKQQQQALRKIVILLPDRPSLAEVNRDIEKGIRAAHQQQPHNATLQLIFIHDDISSEQLLLKAKAFSPDWIIGPLTKSDIQGIQQQLDQHHILLNRIDNATAALQFGLPAEDEVQQIMSRLAPNKGGIAVVASSDPTEQRLLANIQQRANEQAIPVFVIGVEKQNPDLRDWLMQTGGINASQQRIERMRQLTRTNLEAPPYIRNDIQALILLGNAKQAHALMPAIQYYRPRWPIYATSRLLPTRKGDAFNDPDLDGITVLAPPYLNSEQGPETAFEALGWDSYQLLGNPLAFNVKGMSGKLILNTQHQIIRQLDWYTIKHSKLIAP